MKLPEQFRLTAPMFLLHRNLFSQTLQQFITKPGQPDGGLFFIPKLGKKEGLYYRVILGVGDGWEHVSVSLLMDKRCPTWEEMCYIKDLFWAKDQVVVQFHPAEKDYVSDHEYCLHLWRDRTGVFPTPDPGMVGHLKPQNR